MPGIYKLFTSIVALIGNVSLISTGEMNPAFSFIGTGLLWGYYRSFKSLRTLPKWGVGSLSLTTFLVFLFDFYVSGDIFISVAQMTLVFQTIKSFDIKDSWDPPQVFFMSLLQLLIASELTSSLSFGIVFIMFLVFIVIAVLLGHFVKEGQKVFRPFLRPISVVTVVILLLSVMLFVILPRLRSSIWGKSYARGIETAGFSERVDFGSFGEVKLDETVVIRMVLNPDMPGPHYLRGMTFDHFDGIAWYDNFQEERNLFRITSDFHRDVSDDQRKYEAEIYLEPMNSDVIFTFKLPYMFRSPGYFMRENNSGSFFMKRKIAKRFNYRILSIDGFYVDRNHLGSYLQFPDGFVRVGSLTGEIAEGAQSDLKSAYQIRDYLLKNYRYSLYTEMPEAGSNAIEHFLFNSKKGYCEHFATAMTLMLRSINIPARLVTGFLGSQKNAFSDYYVIRQSDAHSW
ncbi:MAG: DUF3488 domain-containing protein, partial [Thermodesulfovibrionia bacterium]|nr:DUF3488 domain-containing protein [Thermodesulfovibrionia bacterium]